MALLHWQPMPHQYSIDFLCKYGLLLKKLLAMSVRDVIWVVSFDSLLKLNPYVDVDNVVGL